MYLIQRPFCVRTTSSCGSRQRNAGESSPAIWLLWASHLAVIFRLVPWAPAPRRCQPSEHFGIGDTLFIVVIALVVFGPKKLPEISRQVGKLMYEFRKASNDFKFQIEEELRASEQAEAQEGSSERRAQPATPSHTAGESVSAADPPAARAPKPRIRQIPSERHSDPASRYPPDSLRSANDQPPEDGSGRIMPPSPARSCPASHAARRPYRRPVIENPQRTSRKHQRAESLDELHGKSRMHEAAAADPSYNQAGDAVPTTMDEDLVERAALR